MLAKVIPAGIADTGARAASDDELQVVLPWVTGSGMANLKPDGGPNTGGLAIATAPGLVGVVTDG